MSLGQEMAAEILSRLGCDLFSFLMIYCIINFSLSVKREVKYLSELTSQKHLKPLPY